MKAQNAIFLRSKSSITSCLMAVVLLLVFSVPTVALAAGPEEMDLDQTLSDGAQRCTIAFDGFAMVTGNLEAQSFFPPGKVADYWGFQYLRDNTPNGNGHNTSFLTNCAFNVLYNLNDAQFTMLKTLADSQVDQINLYAYKRFPLMKAFRRQLTGDVPAGSPGLSLEAVKAASGELYVLDGQLSFDRAVVYASIYRTLDAAQKAHLDAMKNGGFDSWTVSAAMTTAVRERMKGVSHDVSVALMTYAGDLFSWYAGSQDADVYFCPERQGTYFGSFYVKDAPAIGHEGYKIDEQLTASAGQKFLDELATTHLDSLVTGLVDEQRDNLYAGTVNIVKVRTDISTLLRSLIKATAPTDAEKAQLLAQVLAKSHTYGELDGEIVHSYAMAFAQAYQSMTDTQKASMAALRKTIMSGVYNSVHFDFSVCTTPFLYSAVVDPSLLTPYIVNTDYLFDNATTITISPLTATVQTGKTQQFTAKVSGTTNTGVNWQVNGVTGGTPAIGTISASGLYTAPSVVPSPAAVTVTAIASADTTKSASATVTVTVAAPVADFSFAPSPASLGETVSFADATKGGPTSWSWDFGDGAASTLQNPTHAYKQAGSYIVTLVAGNAGGSSTVSKSLTVKVAPPVAGFTFSPSAPTINKPVTFKNASTGSPTSWSWDFGDGTTSKYRNPTHTYGKAGSYTVTLVIANTGGSDTMSKTVTVTVMPPVAAFSFTPRPATTGKTLSFKDLTTGSPTSWSWDFGDNSTSSSQNPTHIYSKAGNYTVTLVATNSGGSGTLSKTIIVRSAPPVAGFSFSPGAPITGSAVSFTDATTGSPTGWFWKFGDGATSRSQNPTHAYARTGNYTVTLVATNSGGSGTLSQTLTVTLAAPVAAFTFSPSSPTAGGAVSFKNASTGSPSSWFWNFGDGSTSKLRNPTHTYTTAGSYSVTLVVGNAAGSNTISQTLAVAAAQRTFTLASEVGVDGGLLPAEYTCDGTGVSPALSWANAPSGTKEFALMMTTLPVDGGVKWNWVLYGIPVTASSLAKNSSGVGIAGVGSDGPTMGYQPPCSQGPGPKLYTFTLYALSASPTLPATADQVTGDVLSKAISSITLGTASLNFSYTRLQSALAVNPQSSEG